MNAGPLDAARWAVVSPWLDRLLDADAQGRAGLLAEAAAEDPALPGELTAWLARLDTQDDDPFMRAAAVDAGALVTAAAAVAGAGDAPGPAGQRVGAYVVQRLLGQGGMGSVWLAQRADGRYDGQVAIKFLHGGLFGRGDARRFAREGHILARLDHPHIARLLDAGLTADDGQPYLVLEFVQGVPIDAYVQAQGLGVRATVALFMDVLAAVAHAHERLALHRDLKPSNILVTPQGQVKLLDFGIAKLVADALDTAPATPATELTQQAGRAYTLRYAAPEQVEGGEATTATDVYALGVLLHLLLTGGLHPTAAADTDAPLAQLQALVNTAPRRPSEAVARQGGAQARRLTRALQGDLDTLIGRALKKRPAERYRNAAELADDLRRYLVHQPIAARPDSAAYRMARFARRNRWGVAAGATVALALGVGTAVALLQAREAQAQSARADQQRQQAEGLVEFMLGDLRDKLEPVGRLDVLDAVASRALAYYAGQSADHLDADALGRRARALGQLAELEQLRARLPEAERLIDSALSITAALVRRFPQQAERLTEHGDTLARKASIRSELMHNAEAAIPLFQQVLDWQQRALALRPGDPKLQVRVADAWFGLGNNFVEMDRPAQALAPLNQALALALALPNVTTQPQLWRTVVDIRSTLGDVHYRLGQYTQAVAVLTPHWTALTQVPGGDEDRALQQRRAQGMNRLASSLLNLGELDAAERTSREVVSQYDELLALDPSNLGRLRDQCFQRLQWAEVRLAAHDRPGAQALLAQVVADLNRLLAVDPNAEHYQFSLKGWLYELQALAAPDDPAVAQAIQRWLDEVVPAFLARTPGLDERSRVRVAAVGMALGDLRAAQGRQAEATQQWQRAQQQVPAATGASAAAKGYRAQLELRLGDKAGAAALAAELQAAGYTSRNQKDLMRRLAG